MLPKDPMMLLSFINTQLRDNYSSLDELCKAYMVSQEDITTTLDSIDYRYDPSYNKFV